MLRRYDLPQYGSRRKLIPPTYDEYGQVIMEDDGYDYSEVCHDCSFMLTQVIVIKKHKTFQIWSIVMFPCQ